MQKIFGKDKLYEEENEYNRTGVHERGYKSKNRNQYNMNSSYSIRLVDQVDNSHKTYIQQLQNDNHHHLKAVTNMHDEANPSSMSTNNLIYL